MEGKPTHDGKKCVCFGPFSACGNQLVANPINSYRSHTFLLVLNRDLIRAEVLHRCPKYDQLMGEQHVSHRCHPPSKNQSLTISCSWNIGINYNPAAGKECGEATPKNAPYSAIIKVLPVEGGERVGLPTRWEGETVGDVVGKVYEE